MNILLYDNGQPFDPWTIYTDPLGGSETSFLLLAHGISEINKDNKCVLLTSKNISKTSYNKLIIDNANMFDGYAENADVILLNRHIPESISHWVSNGKLFYYFAHDAYDQPLVHWMGVKKNFDFFKKVFCVSQWQKDTFIKYFNAPSDKLHVVGNCVDFSLTHGFAERLDNKLIFASIPYKGIDIISDIFNDICIQTKRDDLELHVFSSMGLYNQSDKDNEYDEYFSIIKRTNDIFLKQPVSLKDLIYEFKTSSVYLAPNMYHETFGINLVLAQLCGCLPITTNKGAVNEVIKDQETGFVLNEPNLENIGTYKKFIDLCCDVISTNNDVLYKYRLNASKFAKRWHYLDIAHNVMQEVL